MGPIYYGEGNLERSQEFSHVLCSAISHIGLPQ